MRGESEVTDGLRGAAGSGRVGRRAGGTCSGSERGDGPVGRLDVWWVGAKNSELQLKRPS